MGIDLSAANDFIAAHAAWAVPIIFVVVFCESFAFLSLLVPGTAILAAAGALVGTGTLSVADLLLAAIPAAIAGDGISFWLGRRYGRLLLRSWPLRDHAAMVARGEAFLLRYGAASIFIGRFFGPLRAVVPILAGTVGMRAAPFWAANVASAAVWAPVIVMPGALIGWLAERAGGGRWLLAGVVLVAAGAFAYVAYRRRARAPAVGG